MRSRAQTHVIRVIALACLCLAGGCISLDLRPFSVRVEKWALADGYATAYSVTNAGIQIEILSDFGDPPEQIWTTRLSGAQQEELIRRMRKIPFSSLKDTYQDERIACGVLLRLRFKIDEIDREIELWNVGQPKLQGIVEYINTLLPSEHRFAFFDDNGVPIDAPGDREQHIKEPVSE